MRVPHSCSKMTRRQALAMGAAASVTATIGVPPESVAAATSTLLAGPGPEFLRRSTYVDLVGEDFTAGEHALRLLAVDDVQGAQFDPALKGHESAFGLELDGPADALGSAIHELHHPLIGPFALYLSPVGPVRGSRQTYGITVDRTVRVKSAPDEPKSLAPPPPGERVEPKKAGKDEPTPSEPTQIDVRIVADRLAATDAPAERRRRRARRARRRLRHTYDRRVRFKRKQRTRVRNARTGWLRHHGR